MLCLPLRIRAAVIVQDRYLFLGPRKFLGLRLHISWLKIAWMHSFNFFNVYHSVLCWSVLWSWSFSFFCWLNLVIKLHLRMVTICTAFRSRWKILRFLFLAWDWLCLIRWSDFFNHLDIVFWSTWNWSGPHKYLILGLRFYCFKFYA